MNNIFSVQQLNYERNERVLFQPLSFQLQAGDILQLKGFNGSGKTTLLRLLCGLTPLSRGAIRWNHVDIHQCRETFYQKLHYIGHQLGLKEGLTAMENLQLISAHSAKPTQLTLEQALEALALTQVKRHLVQNLSAGQKRRTALAKLLLLAAPLWILDEPLTALDKQGTQLVLSMMENHSKAGGMVIVTSHQALPFNLSIRELSLS